MCLSIFQFLSFIQFLSSHFKKVFDVQQSHMHVVLRCQHTFDTPDTFFFRVLKPFKEWSMNEAVTVTKIITSLHRLLSFHCALGPMLQPLIAKWSLNRLYKWERFICLEAAVHFSPVIQLISEVAQATRWANRLMIHMWNYCTDLYTIGPYCRACNIIAVIQF